MNKKNSWFAVFVIFIFFVCQTGIFAQKSGYKIVQVKNLDKILKTGRFKKLMAVPVGSELSAYNFAIMTHNKEFWFFENRDDGWLWGTGRY